MNATKGEKLHPMTFIEELLVSWALRIELNFSICILFNAITIHLIKRKKSQRSYTYTESLYFLRRCIICNNDIKRFAMCLLPDKCHAHVHHG